MAVEYMVEWLMDGVEVDEGGDREVACQSEREVIVLAKGVQQVEGLRFRGPGCRWYSAERDGIGCWCGDAETREPCCELRFEECWRSDAECI